MSNTDYSAKYSLLIKEEELQTSEIRYRRLFESARDGILILDAESLKITDVNPYMTELLGYSREEFIGRQVWQFGIFADKEENQSAFQQLQTTGYIRYENMQLETRGGRCWDVEFVCNLYQEGARQVIQCNIRDITARREAEVKLHRLAENLETQRSRLVEAQAVAKVGSWELDLRTDVLTWSEENYRIFGVEKTEFGASYEAFLELLHPEDVAKVNKAYTDSVAKRTPYTIAHRLQMKDGSIKIVQERCQTFYDEAGKPIRSVGTTQDITEGRQAEEELKLSEAKQRQLLERQSAILDVLPAQICLLDAAGNIIAVNETWRQFAAKNKYSGKNFGIGSNYLVVCNNAAGHCSAEAKQTAEGIQSVLSGASNHFELEYPCHSPRETRWFRLTVVPVEKGASSGVVVMHLNITERKQIEEQLLYNTLHDDLTGLANRKLFMNHLNTAIKRRSRRLDANFAVLFLDIDRFKVINDSLGHAEGDRLLKQIALRLESFLRPGDLVARFGGDEFTILLLTLDKEKDALQIAERIQQDLKGGFDLAKREIFTSASIGIALSTAGYTSAEDMLRDADIAMYRAKAKGKAQYQVFDQEMHKDSLELLQLETEMRHALGRREFLLHYQPIINLETNNIIAFEALVRWRHPTRGMILPEEFIPIAEETGLILSLGKWILNESCRQLREWQTGNPAALSLMMSVNLSSKQFQQPFLVEQVSEALETTGLNANCLKLEITESYILGNTEAAVEMMNSLRALGVKICLDDFGTGYSSLSYLQHLPIDYLKIDHSFINQIAKGEEAGEIVYTIIKLAQNLKVKVIAEGIETAFQLARLQQLNCEYGQGYFFSKPLEAEAVSFY